MQELQPGQILGAYRIVRPLGEGGMGCVYEAEHVELKVRRALKVFSSESEHCAELRKKFVQEGRLLADLQHPRIVRVYDFAIDEANGAPYLAMDLVVSPSGLPQTLEDACRNGVEEELVAGWFRDICEGLGYIHSRGVVHRDVSLDNILIDRDGHAVISDFGIAKITGEEYRRKIDITVTLPLPPGEAMRWGKGLYLAPEMKRGAVASPFTDAYALGVLLFRLLVGSWYAPETKLEDMLAGMEYNWAEVIGRLCALDARARLPEGGITAAPASLRRRQPGSGRRWLWVGGLVAFAVLSASLAFWIMRPGSEPSRSVRYGERKGPHRLATPTSDQLKLLKSVLITNALPKER